MQMNNDDDKRKLDEHTTRRRKGVNRPFVMHYIFENETLFSFRMNEFSEENQLLFSSICTVQKKTAQSEKRSPSSDFV